MIDTFHDWPEWLKGLSSQPRDLRAGASEVMKAFGSMAVMARGIFPARSIIPSRGSIPRACRATSPWCLSACLV